MLGAHSPAELLTAGPRLTGSAQGSLAVGRVATQRSRLLDPPGRPEQKYSSSPSVEMHGPCSEDEVLKGGPRFVGAPKVKPAFATGAATPNAKTNRSKIVFFILFFFQISWSYKAVHIAQIPCLRLVFTKTTLIERHLEYLLQKACKTRISQHNISSVNFKKKSQRMA
jgi:hypothetical protein